MANLGARAVVHYAIPVWMAKLVPWPLFMGLESVSLLRASSAHPIPKSNEVVPICAADKRVQRASW